MSTATFLTWTPDATAPMGKRFDSVDLLTCPKCQQPAGYLYKESGVCMSCEVGWIDEDTADEAAAEVWEAPDFFDRCDEAYDAWVDAQFATC